jgi:hypothetical protein
MIRIFDYLRIVTNVDSSLNRGLDGSLASAHGYLARSLGIPEMCAREGKSACSLGSDPKCLTDNRGIHGIHTYIYEVDFSWNMDATPENHSFYLVPQRTIATRQAVPRPTQHRPTISYPSKRTIASFPSLNVQLPLVQLFPF